MIDLLNNPLFQALFNSQVPRIIVVADAPVFTIVTSNDAHKHATNLVGREISGKSVWEVFDPEGAGGDGAVLLGEALTAAQMTNETVVMPPFRYDMGALDGPGMVERWWQLEIMPVGRNGNGPKFLLTTTNNITERIFKERETQIAQLDLARMVEERTARLAASELKFRNLIDQSPIAIALLTAPALTIDAANPQMLRLWASMENRAPESPDLRHFSDKRLADVLPAVAEQYANGIKAVLDTGESYHEQELSYRIGPAGQQREHFASVFFDPIFGQDQTVSGVIVSAIDTTGQVNARKELERAYEQVRLSKQAAQLGTFDMDLPAGTMEWDARCRELFGISHDVEVTYEKDFLTGLHPDDRERIETVISGLFDRSVSDGVYDVEYRTVGAEDGRIRWVRAKGKVLFDPNDRPLRFVGSVLDITDQKHEQRLRHDFIAMASHELKTPLTSLQAHVQLLHRHAVRDRYEVAFHALQQAEKQVIKMAKMINGFLDLSRLESGKLHLNLDRLPIATVIENVASEVRLIHPAASLEITTTEDVTVMVDKDKIEAVLMNLFTNAIKYSRKEKYIRVGCTTDGHTVTVSVTDQGIGIQPAHLDQIFDRFYRIEHPDSKYASGFGIGLYLSQEIILLHQGKIWVESCPGVGSTFYFSLPLAPSGAAEDLAAQPPAANTVQQPPVSTDF
ncbi:PAS domain-containing sensor histidine kinase [Pedobacter yulinensis]|nr:PAS domain-containing sensor histidine kinase [Pedobacter yulinensis]